MDATPRTPTQIRRTSGNAPALPHDWPHRYRPRTGNDAVALGDARNCDCRTAQLSLTTPPLATGREGLAAGYSSTGCSKRRSVSRSNIPSLSHARGATKRPPRAPASTPNSPHRAGPAVSSVDYVYSKSGISAPRERSRTSEAAAYPFPVTSPRRCRLASARADRAALAAPPGERRTRRPSTPSPRRGVELSGGDRHTVVPRPHATAGIGTGPASRLAHLVDEHLLEPRDVGALEFPVDPG